MSHAEFNALYLNEVFGKHSEENKAIFQLNNLLDFDQDTLTDEFLNSLYSNLFVPFVLQPTRMGPNCEILIDQIFSNFASSGPNTFHHPPNSKFNICERDWTKFYQESFVFD